MRFLCEIHRFRLIYIYRYVSVRETFDIKVN